MSAFGSLLGALGGPTTAAALVAGGLVVGIVGGGVVAGAATRGGSEGAAPAAGTLPVYPCPDAGPALASVQGGQRLLVTGRTEDGAWLRIHLPQPGRTEGWVQATPLTVKGDVTSLPVAECQSELEIPAPQVEPEPALTAIVNATEPPTATPTPSPTPSPTPTPAPADKAPTIASLKVTASKISYDTGKYCPDARTSVTFLVRARDDTGLDSVRLLWRKPGTSGFTSATMTRTDGSAANGTWQVTLDTGTNGITTAGRLAYYAVATDTAGQTRRSPSKGSETITVAVCENTGPAITSVSSSAGKTLSWDPLGVGRCQTATDITATVKDIDGVKSVTLFYRPPGSSTWLSKPMNNTTIKGKWYANLDSLGDKISITDPPTDTLRWYIRAVDDKGKSSKTTTKSTTIERCDSEATFFVNSVSSTQRGCPAVPEVRLNWSFSISDPDDIVSATLSYRMTSAGGKTYTQTIKVPVSSQRFSISSAWIDTNGFVGRNAVTWTITTRDKYGGTSAADGKGTVTVQPCLV